MIEDTSFVVDLLRGEKRALERLDLIEGERRPEKVAAITILEPYEGITRSDRMTSNHRCLTCRTPSTSSPPTTR